MNNKQQNRTVTWDEDTHTNLQLIIKSRGFSSVSAWIRWIAKVEADKERAK